MVMGSLGVWVPGLPVVSALVIFCFLRGTRLAARISVAALTITLILALALLIRYLATGDVAIIDSQGVFGSLWLDPLSLVLWAFVSGISLIVHIYSVRYMVEAPG